MPVRGGRRTRRVLRAFAKGVGLESKVLVDNRSRELLGRSGALVPELTRRLLLSGRITQRSRRGSELAVVSYDTPYAVIRHEDFYQPGPITGSKAATQDGAPGRKYLQRPYVAMIREILAEAARIPNRVARRVRRR